MREKSGQFEGKILLAHEHLKRRWSCLGQRCSQLCCASTAGKWSLLSDVPCTSSWCICWITLLQRRWKDAQSPWVVLVAWMQPRTFKGSAGGTGFAALRWLCGWQPASGGTGSRRHPRWLRVPNPQSRRQSVLGAHDGRRGRRRWILSVRVLVWLSGSNRLALRLDAEEASRWWWIGFDDGFYILSRIGSICWGLGSISYHALEVSAEAWHSILHLISYYALAVFTKAWHSILYLITPW